MRIRALCRFAPVAILVAGALLPTSTTFAEPTDLLRAFVTSATYDGNLGGLAGADAICQGTASGATLPNPGAYVAWLSDSSDDAYCRVHGLTGKISANCGLGALPAEAGPWVRVDGVPFADRIDLALSPTGRILAPLALDEDGVPVDRFEVIWTGTTGDGSLHSSNPTPCADWHSADAGVSAMAGSSWATTASWLASGSYDCDWSLHLACLETGPALPLPPYRSGGALVFVTSTSHDGNLGGLAGADATCVSLATSAGLPAPSSFRAWLSTSSVDAVDRLTIDGPWVRPDGVRIADGKSDLVDSYLRTSINVDQTGAYVTNQSAWTGTTESGVANYWRCGDWTSASSGDNGAVGYANRANKQWTNFSTSPCNSTTRRLYCFSDFPAVLFIDDFESQGTTAWSLPAP